MSDNPDCSRPRLRFPRDRRSIVATLLCLTVACVISCRTRHEDRTADLPNDPKPASAEYIPTSGLDPDRASSIDAVIRLLYESITFPAGMNPDMDLFRSLFDTEARFIRITPEQIFEMSLEEFIGGFLRRIESGEMRSFHESEIGRRTNTFGHIAQVFSTYQKGVNTQAQAEFGRGINCIQLFHDGLRWWISSILWEDENAETRIPDEYLY